ncbi:MAG: tRNA (guanosine(46)-N7)-methyltransferase TrmB [Rickettsiaceae bacterium]|nr:tRNA (guanosine(46)-N7)-methyltransferase TrmB [Rickettsiaceae bacterium]
MQSIDFQNHNIIKSFTRRAGHKLSLAKQNIKDNLLPKYLLNIDNISEVANKAPIIEIGFGKGENLIQQALHNKDKFYIGCEVFYQGVISLVSEIEKLSIKNILVWPNDADILIEALPNKSCSDIFILFSDPWTKKRHHKRRFLQAQRIPKLISKLNSSGNIYFASDIENYIENVIADCVDMKIKYLVSEISPFEHYSPTRYHQKAQTMARKVSFIKIHA